MKRFRLSVLTAIATLFAASVFAQTTLNSTTTSAAVTRTAQIISLTSVSNITTSSRNLGGDLIFMDGEAMQANSCDSTAKTCLVTRGVNGRQTAHLSGAFVWTGPNSRFYQNDPVGSCTATSEAFLPHIVLPSSNVYDCLNGEWVRIRTDGYRAATALADTTSTASGTVQSTEYTLNSITLNAHDFASSRGVTCRAWGTGAANANAKNYKIYFGATAVSTLTGTTDSGKDYLAEMTVLRTGASTQAGYGAVTSDIGAPDAFAVTTALTESETAAIVIAFKSANTAAAAASATGKGMTCNLIP